MNIFCAGFPYSLGEDQLKGIFEQYGPVSSVKIIIDRETGKSKGFGFIEMDDEEGTAAINALNGTMVGGRSIAVSKAQEREKKSGGFSRSSGSGGYGNHYGRGGYDKNEDAG
jgi:RNA recognition motif-containing protein